MIDFRNVSNPAAFGIEWEQDGHTYQLVAVRGGRNLTLGIKPKGGPWNYFPVDAPERFTEGKSVTSLTAMKRVVGRWFAMSREAA